MRSEQVKVGVERTPNRSLLYALGYTDEELSRPLVGVVCSYNEIVPGHMNLDKIAEAVKAGIRAAGGTPVEFPAIAVCDGIAMGHIGMKYSLVTRDLIADSTEAMAIAHQFDGLVMIPNCDKNVPGLLMAAARLNLPTVFVSGGPMLAGHLKDGRRTCLSHMFEAVGAYHAGKLDEIHPGIASGEGSKILDEIEDNSLVIEYIPIGNSSKVHHPAYGDEHGTVRARILNLKGKQGEQTARKKGQEQKNCTAYGPRNKLSLRCGKQTLQRKEEIQQWNAQQVQTSPLDSFFPYPGMIQRPS